MSKKSSGIKILNDAELISRYRETGENDFAGELYERYTHLVFGVCVKYLGNEEDARDATIEIFEKLLTDLKRHEVQNFKAWLYSVAKNHCLMKFRRDKTRIENRPELQEDLMTVMEWSTSPHLNNGTVDEADHEKVVEAIGQLNNEQRICIELFYLQEKSYDIISQETGFNYKQVKSYIQNGKRNLKIILNRQHEGKAR